MRNAWWVLAGCVALAIPVGGGLWYHQQSRLDAAAQSEQARQEPEIHDCQQRLKTFYAAWKRYRAEHKGAEPPSFVALVPRYIPKPELLLCPTAERWTKSGGHVTQGTLPIGKRRYPETYGFLWLAGAYQARIKKDGDRAPLITCPVHREVMYRAVYKKGPSPGAFATAERDSMNSRVAGAGILVIRRNGELGVLPPDEE